MAPRILIVDDDESVRDVISVLLREEGYNCVVASGAEMALDIAAAEETPLVISDMKMPGRDGMWLLENFRQRYPDTSVIMLTGYGDTEAAVDSLRKGAVDYLLKPPRLTDLIRAIERALAKRRIEMARRRCLPASDMRSLGCAICSPIPPMPVANSRGLWPSWVAGRWKSSDEPKPASCCCHDVGWSNARSHGSTATDDSPRTSRQPSKAPAHGS